MKTAKTSGFREQNSLAHRILWGLFLSIGLLSSSSSFAQQDPSSPLAGVTLYLGPLVSGFSTAIGGGADGGVQLGFDGGTGIMQIGPCKGQVCTCSGQHCFSAGIGYGGAGSGNSQGGPRLYFPDSPFVYANNPRLNEALAAARFRGEFDGLEKTVDGFPTSLTPEQAMQSGYDFFKGIVNYANNPLPTINPSPLSEPTPLPSGTTRDSFDNYLSGIEGNLENGVI
ncbi:MAG: hypothetical protein AAF202_13110, partial [Pseudomonadota bacterium]